VFDSYVNSPKPPSVDAAVTAAQGARLPWWRRVLQNEDLNFLLTNRLPRDTATRFMGWFSRLESPLLCRASIAVWRCFTDLDLTEAKQQRFLSLHACFTRELKPGSRPIDQTTGVITSPSDGIVGECGEIAGTTLFQAKGFSYELAELLGSAERAEAFRDGCYVTLRLTSAMYHRFHAPSTGHVGHVTYVSGDTWNVNPIALKRVEKLFCKNERAIIDFDLAAERPNDAPLRIALVPVAAILVASIRLHCADVRLHLRYRGPNEIACDAHVQRGEEMGWFEHGSTIIVLAPRGVTLATDISTGAHIRMGQPLMRRDVQASNS
jgi:phosphatidylserine decarboxylase